MKFDQSQLIEALKESMLSPSELIMLTKPFITSTATGIIDQVEYLQEEIESKGGHENMSDEQSYEYDTNISNLMNEIAARN